eukprot:91723_1
MGDTLKGVIGILFDEDNERCAASTSTCRRWLRFKLLVLNLLVLSLNLVVEISSDDMALAWDETSKKGTSYNAVLCCYELCDKMESMVMGYVVMSGKDTEHCLRSIYYVIDWVKPDGETNVQKNSMHCLIPNV